MKKISISSGISYNRHLLISKYLEEHNSGTVEDFCQLLNVSPATVRRELNTMDSLGLVTRIYGGATLKRPEAGNDHITAEQKFSSKSKKYQIEKERIARTAVELIPDNAVIFVNSGSTTYEFIKAIQNRAVNIVTNNANTIGIAGNSRANVFFVGGEYRPQSRSFVGHMAVNTIQGIFSTFTVLGTNGFSLERGLTTTINQECDINQTMAKNTLGKVIVLADHSKIGATSNFISVPLTDVDILITDEPLDEETINNLHAYGIEIIVSD